MNDSHTPAPRLCVAMATYDDFDGVYFTIQAMRLTQQDVIERTAFLVLDNHPEGADGQALRQFAAGVADIRYVPFSGYRSTAVRDLLFREADAEIVLCVDAHVVLRPGALAALIAYLERDGTARDIVQGPLLDDALDGIVGTHFEPSWSEGMYGRWEVDDRVREPGGAPFEIPMQGLGVFACRRDAWPGINPRFRGFGGEEGYLHERFRRRGGRAVCLPALAWGHRFERPSGIPYAAGWQDRVRNYLIGWSEVGWDVGEVDAHFRAHLQPGEAQETLAAAKRQIESPLTFFDAVVRLDADGDQERREEIDERLADLDVAWRLERIAPDPAQHPIRAAVLSYRSIVELADRRAYGSVLVLSGNLAVIDGALEVLRDAVAQLGTRSWDLLWLGGCEGGEASASAQEDSLRPLPEGSLRTHAVAVHSSAYARLLDDLPAVADGPEMAQFLSDHGDLERFLQRKVADGAYSALAVFPQVVRELPAVAGGVPDPVPAPADEPEATTEVVLHVRAFGADVSLVDTTRLGIADRVAALMPLDSITGAAVRDGQTFTASGGDHGVSVICDGYAPYGPVSSEEAVGWLRGAIDASVACAATEATFVHAGVVAWRDRAILLPGRSGIGKSMLTDALVQAGAVYYSDDLAPIDADGLVHSYAKVPSPEGAGGQTRQIRSPIGSSPRPPLRIALIVSTSFEPGALWQPQVSRGAIGVLPLLRNAVIGRAKPEGVMAIAGVIGATSVTLSGPRPEARSVAGRILETLDGLLDDQLVRASAA
jgi:hypothetical protein